MQHCIDDLFEREKLTLVIRVPQSKAYFLAFVDIKSKEILLMRIEFAERSYFPGPPAHDRFDQRCDLFEHCQGFRFPGSVPVMLIFKD